MFTFFSGFSYKLPENTIDNLTSQSLCFQIKELDSGSCSELNVKQPALLNKRNTNSGISGFLPVSPLHHAALEKEKVQTFPTIFL